jgi:hypothetical protein
MNEPLTSAAYSLIPSPIVQMAGRLPKWNGRLRKSGGRGRACVPNGFFKNNCGIDIRPAAATRPAGRLAMRAGARDGPDATGFAAARDGGTRPVVLVFGSSGHLLLSCDFHAEGGKPPIVNPDSERSQLVALSAPYKHAFSLDQIFGKSREKAAKVCTGGYTF